MMKNDSRSLVSWYSGDGKTQIDTLICLCLFVLSPFYNILHMYVPEMIRESNMATLIFRQPSTSLTICKKASALSLNES